jgi:hypothetical protein
MVKKHKQQQLLGFIIITALAILLGVAIWFFYNVQLTEIDKQIEQVNKNE